MSIWQDFMNTIRGSLRHKPERKEGPAAVADDSDHRPLTPDAELPRRDSPGRHAVIDSTEEPRRQESANEPLTPDYDPKRGPQC